MKIVLCETNYSEKSHETFHSKKTLHSCKTQVKLALSNSYLTVGVLKLHSAVIMHGSNLNNFRNDNFYYFALPCRKPSSFHITCITKFCQLQRIMWLSYLYGTSKYIGYYIKAALQVSVPNIIKFSNLLHASLQIAVGYTKHY
jgi:hypothetical protein